MIVGGEMQLLQTCEWYRGGRRVFKVANVRQGGFTEPGSGLYRSGPCSRSTITQRQLQPYNKYLILRRRCALILRGISVQHVITYHLQRLSSGILGVCGKEAVSIFNHSDSNLGTTYNIKYNTSLFNFSTPAGHSPHQLDEFIIQKRKENIITLMMGLFLARRSCLFPRLALFHLAFFRLALFRRNLSASPSDGNK